MNDPDPTMPAPSNGASPMTSAERASLLVLCRQRERVAKANAAQYGAELLADFERKLAAIYSFDDDDTWAAANRMAAEAVGAAKKEIAERCQELGIPRKFAPTIELHWYGRGENASKERRAELTRVARSEIDRRTKTALAAIAAKSVDVQTKLIASGLTTDAAQQFLEQMPQPAELMPALDVAGVELLLDQPRRLR